MIDVKPNRKRKFFPDRIGKNQAKDTGMAMVLICLLCGYFGQNDTWVVLSIPLLIINMIFPDIYRPLAKIWLGISVLLGTIMSKFILTIIFFVILTPIGITRKMFGADAMQIKKWKKNSDSVFKVRNHIFEPKEIEKPY
jgi:multisubunit Na+/H+ antiporter MnhG subunit